MLVEREYFLAALTRLLDEAVTGRGRLAFLGGEAGVGKTALVSALAAAAGDRVAVRRGGCDSLATAAPLGPLTEAVPEILDVVEASDEVNRPRLFRSLRDVLAAQPTLLVIEDVHWGDEATLEMLRYLGRRLDGLPLLIVATYRADEVSRLHELTVVLGDLATSAGVARMQLPPLTPAGVEQLVRAAGSALDANAVHVSTGGNPFYVTEVLAAGATAVPATVRDAVLARAARLSAPAQQVLAAAAVLGPRAELRTLTAVASQGTVAVDECVRLGMLVEDGHDGRGGALTFRHELARLAIEQTLTPGARAELHAVALRTLRAAGERDDRRLAHHAAACGDRAAVAEHAPRAAARAARLGAHREAAENYRLAVAFHDGPDDLRADLFEALSYECYLTDQLDDAFTARVEAMRHFDQAGDTLGAGRSQRWLSRLSWFLGRNEQSEQYAAAAVSTLEPLGANHELAMAYSNQAQLRMLANDSAQAIEWGNRAIVLARRIGDRETECHALNNIGTALAHEGDALDGEQRLAQSLDLALTEDLHEHAARAYTNLGSIPVANRRFAAGDRQLRAGIAYATERDLDSWRLYMSAWLARSLCEQGRYAAAAQCAHEVLRQPHLSPITKVPALVVSAQLAMRRGDDSSAQLAEAAELAEAIGEAQRLVPVAVAQAEAAWLDGRTHDLVAAVDRAWSVALQHPNPWDVGELAWWLSVAGERRPAVAVARPFALMLDGAFSDAAQEWQAIGAPLWAALALGASADLADARDALDLVDGLGAPAVRTALLRDRYERGLPVPRGPRPSSRANPSGLTQRELEVLRLLADGLSNAQVAGRLFLSEKTVGHHVSSVLRKLDEPSRTRAVAAALKAGILTEPGAPKP